MPPCVSGTTPLLFRIPSRPSQLRAHGIPPNARIGSECARRGQREARLAKVGVPTHNYCPLDGSISFWMRTQRPAGGPSGEGSRAHRADIGGMRTATPPQSHSKMPSRAHPKRFSPNCLSCIGGFSYFSHYVVKTRANIVVSRFSFAMRTHMPARGPFGESWFAHRRRSDPITKNRRRE